MQIGQRSLVIQPGDFGHKGLDKTERALGAIDETALDFARLCIFVAIASLVEEALGAPSFFRRRQIEKGQEVAGLVMRALLLELSAALNVHQSGCDVREMAFGIFAGGMTLRLDKDGPARTEPTQRVVQSPGNADEFGGHSGIQIRPPKFCRALKRAILVEDDTLVDQGSPGQEVRKLRGRAPILPEVHHRFKRSNSWR